MARSGARLSIVGPGQYPLAPDAVNIDLTGVCDRPDYLFSASCVPGSRVRENIEFLILRHWALRPTGHTGCTCCDGIWHRYVDREAASG